MRKVIAIALLLALVASFGAWTYTEQADRQATAHEIAELARSLGLPENDPIIERAREIWWEAEEAPTYSDEDLRILANVLWHEARGIEADVELACVAWTVCNRVDAGYGTLREVMTAPYQFAYVDGKTFDETDPVYARCREIAADVLERWSREKNGAAEVGRVLPKGYLWYSGDGEHNWFRDAYIGGNTWDCSLPDVYGEGTSDGEETESAQGACITTGRGTGGAPWSGVWCEYGYGDLLHCAAGQAWGYEGGTASVLAGGVRAVGFDYEGICQYGGSAGYTGEGIRD